ncbi:hypothetical protein [Wenxinia marina]|uniref:Lipopolysaccharide-assembly, LptC-related protein n=1 Tax=Wenxinia marina DSM 24838 TaxID=1123501 RepID=A0A0D0NRX1_9RHOB|nr:hypothetical protein [Wenxinia marina]KIQ70985.1 hypothetical protein Wenmar_00363 [Wenxinia marina DSM 24838]GGL55745.1 hypothetical protein GCM10011392_07710 [Wenxinia marina]
MTQAGDAHTRVVAAAKVALPLVALALLSTLFLFARTGGPDPDIRYSDVEAIAREPRVTAPAFAGIGRNGAVISMRAGEMRPVDGDTQSFTATKLAAEMSMPDGRRFELSAETGAYDAATRTAQLTGLARVDTSDGYSMETAGLEADLGAGTLRSLGPLEVHAPFGELTAARMSVENAEGGPRLMFSGGVRLIYRPDRTGDRP